MHNELDVFAIRSYLDALRDMCGSAPIVDIHVHATEVIKGKARYGKPHNGVISASAGDAYKRPELVNIRLASPPVMIDSARRNKLSEMAFTQNYRHTGPQVLGQHMELANIDKAVLLPVASANYSMAEQMDIIDFFCTNDDRFIAGYCMPADVPDAMIYDDLALAVQRFGVRVVKIHPNITGIDLTEKAGRARLQEILSACGRHALPVVLHGGCSPILGDVPASRYSSLHNLSAIDWAVTSAPVVIAHFGIYGCNNSEGPASEASKQALLDLLNSHLQLFTDTSGVSYEAILTMLSIVDPAKIIFGSDALYVPAFRQIVLVMHALHELGHDPFIIKKIACDNAAQVLDLA